tara:strand:- start:968 stop:1339 length:372 start_codon:yes stop_codon:yes gene_type:complete
MITLIIDAAQDKVFFKIIKDNKSYTNEFSNSRENFDKFTGLLFKFLKKNNINANKINNILINLGPGKSSSIRASISIAKALSITNKLNLCGFKSKQVKNKNYNEIFELFSKGKLKKNLIKPNY